LEYSFWEEMGFLIRMEKLYIKSSRIICIEVNAKSICRKSKQ